MSQRPLCKRLFLLVGSNPLPNFLASIILNPQSICFFYTDESQPVKNYLEKALNKRFFNRYLNAPSQKILDATDASGIRDVFRKSFDSVSEQDHLHYTGGTKVMAAQARIAFENALGYSEQADKCSSYIDERKGLMRFDDGGYIEIPKNLKMTMAEILELHGFDIISICQLQNGPVFEQNITNIAQAVCESPGLIKDLNRGPVEKYSELIPALNAQIVREYQDRFQKGKWLEDYVGGLIRNIAKEADICIGLKSLRTNKRDFEIDIALTLGYRLFVITCTTKLKLQDCKLKIFEAAMRASQLGGDLARSAIVCLVDGGDEKGPYKKQLEDDVRKIWASSNTPEIFSLADLKEWAGIDGPINIITLKNWLKS